MGPQAQVWSASDAQQAVQERTLRCDGRFTGLGTGFLTVGPDCLRCKISQAVRALFHVLDDDSTMVRYNTFRMGCKSHINK